MTDGTQIIEKNHFPARWNQAMVSSMIPSVPAKASSLSNRAWLILIAVALAAATLAPVAVLAA